MDFDEEWEIRKRLNRSDTDRQIAADVLRNEFVKILDNNKKKFDLYLPQDVSVDEQMQYVRMLENGWRSWWCLDCKQTCTLQNIVPDKFVNYSEILASLPENYQIYVKLLQDYCSMIHCACDEKNNKPTVIQPLTLLYN